MTPVNGRKAMPRVDHLKEVGGRFEARRRNLWRRQLGHDVRHQLSTIALLASVLNTSSDVGAGGRARVAQLLIETRWLAELFRLYERELDSYEQTEGEVDGPARLDVVAADVVRPVEMGGRRIVLESTPVLANVGRLGMWRALRNLVGNAVTAAGPDGQVLVRVAAEKGLAVVEVHDDGPGFDGATVRPEALGLAIVRSFVDAHDGRLAISRGAHRGTVVRLEFPAAW